MVKVNEGNKLNLLSTMRDVNKNNERNYTPSHWMHEFERIREFGQLPFDALKLVLTEEDYNNSYFEWNKKAKNKKWYHVMANAFINYLYEREIADAQEKGINEYYDSLLQPSVEKAKGRVVTRRPGVRTSRRWCQGETLG